MRELVFRINQRLLLWILLGYIMYHGSTFLIPIAFAIVLAMLMAPLGNLLDKKMSRPFSTLICVFILILAMLTMLGVIAGQFVAFSEDLPQIKEKAEKFFSSTQDFVEQKFAVSEQQQIGMLKEQLQSAGKAAGGFLQSLVGGFAAIATGVALTFVYSFLLIYHREKYTRFFVKIFSNGNPDKVKEVIDKVCEVSQKYLLGRVISIALLILLYSIGLLIVGVNYAILLAAVAGLLAFIPYVGTALGGLFPVIMALVTQDTNTALWAGIVIVAIQAFDNYLIEPAVVGGEVSLSALTTILAIIAGGLMWGAAGMILFIPLIGMAKVVFDHVEELKPYGYLIGDPGKDTSSKIKDWFKKVFNKE